MAVIFLTHQLIARYTENMQITILGAGGRVGQLVTEISLARGYEVVALVHSHSPYVEHAGLTVVKGDIYERSTIDHVIRGSQAVISTLGSWHTPQQNVLEQAMLALIPEMQSQGIRRLITVTGSAALLERDHARWYQKIDHLFLKIIAPKVLRDGEAHLRLLSASNLDWTSIRSPVMTKQTATQYRLRATLPTGMKFISMRAVATALVDQIYQTTFFHQAPIIDKP
jgi:putative NADH-flavin reductase